LGIDNNILGSDDGSLADFEEELLTQQKTKSYRNLFFVLLLLALFSSIGFYAWKKGKISTDIVSKLRKSEDKKGMADSALKADETGKAPSDKKGKKDIDIERIEPDSVKTSSTYKIKVQPGEARSGKYFLQVGIFAEKKNAEKVLKMLEKAGLDPRSSDTMIPSKRVRVVVGHFPFRELAMDEAAALRNKGFKPKVQIMAPGVYSLIMGNFATVKEAKKLISELEDKGIPVRTDYKLTRDFMIPATVVYLKDIEAGDSLDKAEALLKRNKIEYTLRK